VMSIFSIGNSLRSLDNLTWSISATVAFLLRLDCFSTVHLCTV
jgi:hypothetical protein